MTELAKFVRSTQTKEFKLGVIFDNTGPFADAGSYAGLPTPMAIAKPRAGTISPMRPVRRNCGRVCDM